MTYLTSIVHVFAFLLLLAAIQAVRDHRRRKGLPYPPGPRRLPIIGNLLDIPKHFSWLAYTRFSETHGVPSLSFAKVFSDKNDRGCLVFPYFWAGYRRIEHRQSYQGPP